MGIDQEAEGRHLEALFVKHKIKNRAEFARDNGVPGGGAMIYQHITGLKPISLKAGQAYAKGFGCSLRDVCPRLAQLISGYEPTVAREPASARQLRAAYPRTRADVLSGMQSELIRLFAGMSDAHKLALVAHANALYTIDNPSDKRAAPFSHLEIPAEDKKK